MIIIWLVLKLYLAVFAAACALGAVIWIFLLLFSPVLAICWVADRLDRKRRIKELAQHP
jgi:hypothetical protein